MSKIFGWGEKFKQGMDAESLFPSLYKGGVLTKHETREFDFDRDDGARVELKADQYPIERTVCFFIERWSVFEQKKPGSLWQSVNKADIFIYYFAKSGVYFEFEDIPAAIFEILKFVDSQNLELIFIKNKGYCGAGWKIPRSVLQHLYKEVQVNAV